MVLQNILCEANCIEARFKQISTIAQSVVESCDKESSENRLKELRRLKERLVKLRKDAVTRQKLLQNILPTIKSLSAGLSELSLWLSEADGILSAHFIGGELVAVVKRIDIHKVAFCVFLLCIKFARMIILGPHVGLDIKE